MMTARTIAEKWFPKADSDTKELELDILRYLEDQLWRKFGDMGKTWGALIQEHAHQWEDDYDPMFHSQTSAVPYIKCRICGKRKLKYQTY